MSKSKPLLSEDTIIVWKEIPVNEYRKFFVHGIGEEIISGSHMDFQNWLFSQTGKTLKETVEDYFNPQKPQNMEECATRSDFI